MLPPSPDRGSPFLNPHGVAEFTLYGDPVQLTASSRPFADYDGPRAHHAVEVDTYDDAAMDALRAKVPEGNVLLSVVVER